MKAILINSAPFWSAEYYVAVKIDAHRVCTSAWVQLIPVECMRGRSHSRVRRQTHRLEEPKVHPLSFRAQGVQNGAFSCNVSNSFCCVPTSFLFVSL